MANENRRPTREQFLTDPAFQEDRELFFACVDERMKFYEAERKKNNPEPQFTNIFDFLFGSKKA